VIDTYTKIVLTVIALTLSLLALEPAYAPRSAHASPDDLSRVEGLLQDISHHLDSIHSSWGASLFDSPGRLLDEIASDVASIESDLDDIEDGTCLNRRICGPVPAAPEAQ